MRVYLGRLWPLKIGLGFLGDIGICSIIGLSFRQKGMDTRIPPLLLRGARTMPCTPGGQPPIVDLLDIAQRNAGGLCLRRQALCLRKSAREAGRIFGFLCLDSLVCCEGAVGRRILVRHGLSPPDFFGSAGRLACGEPRKVFIGFKSHSNLCRE